MILAAHMARLFGASGEVGLGPPGRRWIGDLESIELADGRQVPVDGAMGIVDGELATAPTVRDLTRGRTLTPAGLPRGTREYRPAALLYRRSPDIEPTRAPGGDLWRHAVRRTRVAVTPDGSAVILAAPGAHLSPLTPGDYLSGG